MGKGEEEEGLKGDDRSREVTVSQHYLRKKYPNSTSGKNFPAVPQELCQFQFTYVCSCPGSNIQGQNGHFWKVQG
jgi:hypothetical protein